MTPLVLALVLSSALIHAAWNLWIKQIGDSGRRTTLIWMLTAISAVAYAPVAILVFATGTWRPELSDLPWILGSGVIHVGYFFLLLAGYRAADLSVVYPLARGTGPLLAALGAFAWFGERPNAFSIAGILLVVTGVLTLALKPGLLRDPKAGAGVRWGLLTGASIAVYVLWDGWAVKHVGIPALVYYWCGEVVRTVVLAPAALADRASLARWWRDHRGRVLGTALLSPLSYILILYAIVLGPVSHIAPARELSIVIGAWLGGRVLGEGERKRRLLAAAAFAAGVVALALA